MHNALVVFQASIQRRLVPHRMYASSVLATPMRLKQVAITLTVLATAATRDRMGPRVMPARLGNTRTLWVLYLARTVL